MSEYQKLMGVSAKNSGISGVGSSLKEKDIKITNKNVTNLNLTINDGVGKKLKVDSDTQKAIQATTESYKIELQAQMGGRNTD